jgi:endonuclease III
LHGRQALPPARDPFRLLLWEQVAYLTDDAGRLAAYQLLEEKVGTTPDAILAAPLAVLRAVTRRGGAISVNQRADRLRLIAERVVGEWDGDLDRVLELPFAEARRELTKYPSIGEAGADRILLLCGAYPVLGLDSNALRVLARLGYADESSQWTKTYRQAKLAAEAELAQTGAARQSAYLLLRHHGQTLCRRSAPMCNECPLRADCPTGIRAPLA